VTVKNVLEDDIYFFPLPYVAFYG